MMDRRDELKIYNKQRLTFEGVLIDTISPNQRNGYTYGLVFASIYATHEKFEIDHVVIQVTVAEYFKSKIELFKRYSFTAKISKYEKVGLVLGVFALRECYMVGDINILKISEKEESDIEQPTKYVKQRIDNIIKSPDNIHDENVLIRTILSEPNDGSVERLVDVYTRELQRKPINNIEMLEAIY